MKGRHRLILSTILVSSVCLGGAHAADVTYGTGFDRDAFIQSAEEKRVLDLGLVECVTMALKNNSEIKIKKIEPAIAANRLRRATGAFEPSLTGYYNYDETTEAGLMPRLTGTTQNMSREIDFSAGIEGKTFLNTEYALSLDNSISGSNSALQRFFPDYDGTLNGKITQPVLKDFVGMGADQANIVISKNKKEMSQLDLTNEVISIVSKVALTYFDYVRNIDQYKVGELSLKRSQDLKGILVQRYAKGLASSVELLEADAGVAKREEALLYFEKVVKKTEDDLKLVTNLVDDPKLWNASIHPKDRPELKVMDMGLADNIVEAFENRMDYQWAKIDLKNKDVDVKLAHNSLWPTVDVVATYAANGLSDKYGSVIDQIGDGTNGSWSVGVNVKVPFGYAKEVADYKISKLEKEKAILAFSRLEQRIILEVRDAVRNVDIGRRNVRAAEKTLRAEEKTYEAMLERFRGGLVSTHDMLQYQESLDLAQLNYLDAAIGYTNALVELYKTKGTTLKKNKIKIE